MTSIFSASVALVGCSSNLKNVENCKYSAAFTKSISGKKNSLKVCSYEKDKKARIYHKGIYNQTTKKWLLESRYSDIVFFNGNRALVRESSKQPYQFFDLDTLQLTPTDITGIRKIKTNDNNTAYSASIYYRNNKTTQIALIDPWSGQIRKKIDNADEWKYGSRPFFTSVGGGYAIRQVHADGSKHFYFYGESGQELRPPLSADNVVPTTIYIKSAKNPKWQDKMTTLVEVVDADKELFWPLFFDRQSYLKKPENLKGFLVRQKNPRAAKKNISLTQLLGVYKNQKYLSYHNVVFPRPLHQRLDFLKQPSLKQGLTEVKRVATGGDSSTLLYIFENGIQPAGINQIFANEELAMAAINKKNNEKKTLSAQQKKDYENRQKVINQQKQAAYEAQRKEQQRFINHIHKYGPNPQSTSTYSYDVALYCNYKGPKCHSYRMLARKYERDQNARNEMRNMQRLYRVYNKNPVAPGSQSQMGQAAEGRFKKAVRRAKQQDRERKEAESWKRQMRDLTK